MHHKIAFSSKTAKARGQLKAHHKEHPKVYLSALAMPTAQNFGRCYAPGALLYVYIEGFAL